MGIALWKNQETNDLGDLIERGDWVELARTLGFRGRQLRLVNYALAQWGLDMLEHAQVHLLHAEGSLRVILVDGEVSPAAARAAMDSLHRRNPADVTLWWWANPEQLRVAMVCERGENQRFIRRMSIARNKPDAVSLRQLECLHPGDWVAPDQPDVGQAIRRHMESILDQETLTREFFTGFKRALDLLEQTMVGGPQSQVERHDVSLLTLLRLLFLYFLQARGALGEDPHFMIRAWRSRERKSSFYRSVIRPLFFNALNTPTSLRDADQEHLGRIPFLNGGLFDPSPVEGDCPDLDWPDATLQALLEDLFERYQFAITETSSDEEDRVIDPEMLGKVFEGLMFGDARHRSGAYYTPRHIVREMVNNVIGDHLIQHTGLGTDRIQALMDGRAHLSLDERDVLREVLNELTILDPAVGTGAFLLEALRVLVLLWSRIDGVAIDHVRLRDVIHHHLYGVDINPTATRLCELRLWIALLGATPPHCVTEMPPLPNLSHRIVCGHSLVDPEDIGAFNTEWRCFGHGWRHDAKTQELASLHDRFLNCHGSKKYELREELTRAQRAVYSNILQDRITALDRQIGGLERVQSSKDLFGETQITSSGKRSLDDLRAHRARLQKWSGEIRTEKSGAPAFSYAMNFPQVAAQGGFDIVITNPPWVRAHHIAPEELDLYKAKFSVTHPGFWSEASRRGITASFGSQVDLSAIFLERSLELLKPGGRLCALVPSKIFRSLHGTATRKLLTNFHIQRLVDFSDAADEMFDATTYPAMVQVQDAPSGRTNVSVFKGERNHSWQETLPDEGEPFFLVPPQVQAIFKKMSAHGTANFSPGRGVFTGANAIFIRKEDEFLKEIGEVVRPYLRPVLSGRNPTGSGKTRILWLYDETGSVLENIPEELVQYFEQHRDLLTARSDYDPRLPLWQVFRVRPDTCSTKVVWRDIAQTLETHLSSPDAIPLNTLYYLPCPTAQAGRAIQAFLESAPTRAFARASAERARGGYRRHFAWVVRLLPTPPALVEAIEKGDCPEQSTEDLLGLSALEVQRLKAWLKGEEAKWS